MHNSIEEEGFLNFQYELRQFTGNMAWHGLVCLGILGHWRQFILEIEKPILFPGEKCHEITEL